ncbi:MAG TPA: hypothetical protein VJU61_13170, partial [Polyangiaceae bacterium]|nr:hypothetical protein [Polyangiaceae bacterium]
MRHSGWHVSRGMRRCVGVLALLLAGCNAIFDIDERTPRRVCADPLLIDDLEDGNDEICTTGGR